MRNEPIKITGLILVDKLLEFISINPNPINWNWDKQRLYESNYARFKQLDVLIKLFVPECYNASNLKESIESFLNAEFILRRDIKNYKILFSKMDRLILDSKLGKPFKKRKFSWDIDYLQSNFKRALEYKIKIKELRDFNSDYIEISYPYFFSLILTDNISNKIKTNSLDVFLMEVIDPKKKVYNRNKLIKNYEYPEANVYSLEMDEPW